MTNPQSIPTDDQTRRKAADWLLGLTHDLVLKLQTISRSDAAQRSKWFQELWVWGQYLEKIGAGYDVANQPIQLAIALDEISDGIVDPLLSPGVKVKDDPGRIWRGRTWAALGMECLLKKGLTRKTASQEAVARWPGLKPLLHGPRSNLRSSLLSWHDRFMNAEIKHSGAKAAFKLAYAQIGLNAALSTGDCDRWAQFCFSRAMKFADP
jgi:hypothetical protein